MSAPTSAPPISTTHSRGIFNQQSFGAIMEGNQESSQTGLQKGKQKAQQESLEVDNTGFDPSAHNISGGSCPWD
jgi:hypothetical protein